MKRGAPLRRTVLVARVPLQRTGRLARSGLASTTRIAVKPIKQRAARYTGPDRKTRTLVLERDGGRCVHCGAPATDKHHRKNRGRGGSSDPAINSPANLLSLCRRSHDWIESNRIEAEALGYLVRHGVTDPAQVAVWAFNPWPLLASHHLWILLRHDGTKVREIA